MNNMMINGEFVNEANGAIVLKSPSIRYGIMVFDATNVYYNTEKNTHMVFRITDHVNRLFYSCEQIGLKLRFSKDEVLIQASNLLKNSEFSDTVGLRFFVYYNQEDSFITNNYADLAIYILDISKMRAQESIKLFISDYQKSENGMLPVQVKSTAHYAYSRIAVMKAQRLGYDEVVFLNQQGHVTECSRSNLFIIKNGEVITPTLSSCVLDGITRKSIITLCLELNIPVSEKVLTRYDLYSSNAIFTTGSSLGITPVSEIDSVPFTDEKAKGIFTKIKNAYVECCKGERNQEWLMIIPKN